MEEDIFKKHIQKFVQISEEEFSEIKTYFRSLELRKKEYLLKHGDICKMNFFVLKGCLRKFFISEKGVEHTTEFAIENWWMTDNFAYEKEMRSDFNIQTVEKSIVLVIDKVNHDKLLQKHPLMERYFRMIYQRAYAAAERRIRFLYEFSREELYLHFRSQYPEFLQRIPQYLIASYLGFTPEYLSEIRGKLRS
ncbi:putative transcriptional regulator, Crp/Fnr family [Pseudopedobacter saltans DSM 12145]|uniref:Transcriptional regulator, Crp/Fnr family n=1 Tax=Pseudopedobacter saltans (strain ATCC 51119 / DSM 12145 / JCM 21818 / CCUG 39354 / LMG 10337 / NBRC 100064 / NCIMB 13643) TaxID=762903 RepID=F0S6I6_PSESL|nr:Crp/Fnr family transcriptional regulator [Pseudopedobacter saltans]ADY51062.1 putative transcriptional regulator, Crp/Fnr family [Pseudopedobacter saltans DSM 12145]